MGDPRYLRPSSPPRRYAGHPSRNSVGALDLHPTYDRYGNPIKSREPLSGPGGSSERLGPRPPAPPRPLRDTVPIRARGPDGYDPRRLEPIRRPLSVTPSTATSSYHSALSAEKSPQHYSKPWPREDESYYIQPNSSTRRSLGHSHHPSLDTRNKPEAYLAPVRSDRDRGERGGYRSSGYGGARQTQYQDAPQIRPPRDKDDRDFGYEYTDFKEQAYRDTAPRVRTRRGSDAGARERPHSITGLEDVVQPQRSGRAPRETYGREGPPVSTRGFSKIDRNGSIRHEYRYPREPDSGRSGDESEGPSRRRSTKPAVALHQDKPEGYTSNVDDRGIEKPRHRHRADSVDRSTRPRGESIDRVSRPRGDSIDRTTRRRGESFDRGNDDRARHVKPDEDSRRDKYRDRKYDSVRSESQDRRGHHQQPRQYPEPPQDRYRPDATRRERVEEPERDHKHRDRGDDYDKRREDGKNDKRESHFGSGAALGAAGAAAAGLLGAKHHYSKEKEKEKAASDVSSSAPREAKQSLAPEPSEASTLSDNSDRERRERRRRRRLEKEERERQEALAAGGSKERLAPPIPELPRSTSRDRGGHYPPEINNKEEEESSRRHRRKPSERRHSSSESSEEEAPKRQVRVVSPGGKAPEIKPKGILRRPREKFPEDPAPVREGVAPLKDAGKKGIPPNARWTKIDRRLVNPEALELGNERFEERSDYVIVLRVLSKEEIELYAAKTTEIRETRHREANQHRIEAPKDEDGYDDYDGNEDDYEKPPPKAIEPAYNSNETFQPRDREQQRMEPYFQASQAPPPSMTASAPTLAPNVAMDDPDRPGLYPSNSYHRMAPTASASEASSVNSSTVLPTNPAAYPPPPMQQAANQAPPGTYASQQPVTGEYSSAGYPMVPPSSQPVYPGGYQGNNQPAAPYPPPVAPQPWQQQPLPHAQPAGAAPQAEPVQMPPMPDHSGVI